MSDSKQIKYSICTLVTKPDQYIQMKQSYIQADFTELDCEFLSINNATNNNFDAYSGLNHLIEQSTGSYIICCHQDVLIQPDNRADLESKVEEIQRLDANWAVISNCGGISIMNYALRVTEGNGKIRDTKNFPTLVTSVDEHFILLNQQAKLTFNKNLTGFHFYGTDICLQAQLKGYKSYAIDFNITHFGGGTIDHTFFTCKNNLINEYQPKNVDFGWIQTTCARVYISNSKLKNKLYNLKPISYLVKKYWKLRLGI